MAFEADREFGLKGIAHVVLIKNAVLFLKRAMRGHQVQGGLIYLCYVHTAYISLRLSNNFNIDYNPQI
jgi:hypothetical protein